MANYKTGAQRYNDRVDKIFDRAKSEGRGLVGNSGVEGVGVNSPTMKAQKSAMKKKSGYASDFGHGDRHYRSQLHAKSPVRINTAIAKRFGKLK